MSVAKPETLHSPYPEVLTIADRPDMLLYLTGSRDDAAELQALIATDWDYLARFQHLDEADSTLAAVEAATRKTVQDMQNGTDLQYVVMANERIVGRVGFAGIDHKRGAGRLGYWVGEASQGHGYAHSAAQRLVRFAFEEMELEKVLVRIDARNEKSEQVARGLGAHRTPRVALEEHERRRIRYRIWEIDKDE
ncbi:MAG TPA: GNAT family N-acetyltransferase [Candidatus Saccharimonadales bacterium]